MNHTNKNCGKKYQSQKKPISMPKGDLQCVINDGSLLEYVVHTH